ncbi:GreA/GreB family elongation factor [Verrucomicrobiota bacterium]
MKQNEELKERNSEELEAEFLAGLEKETMPLQEMLGILSRLASTENLGSANSCAELLREKLIECSDKDGIKELLKLECEWRADDPGFQGYCRKTARAVFDDRLGKALVVNAGFDKKLPAGECIRRLDILTRLAPGIFCRDNTWGFGVVNKLDDFYLKATIDFYKKPRHEMSFAYAGETLELLDDTHLLVRKHTDPDELGQLVKDDPAEVVRMAIRSFGSMNAPRLKEVLTDGILSESDWKNFWEAARKQLKKDALVDLPAKRNDPIRLLEKKKEYDKQWFDKLGKERDSVRILELVRELTQAEAGDISGDNVHEIIRDRLKFVITGAEGKQPDIVAQAVICASRMGLTDDASLNISKYTDMLLEPGNLISATNSLPAQEIKNLVKYLASCDREKTEQTFLDVLVEMQLTFLNEAVAFLFSANKQKEFGECLGSALTAQHVSVQLLYWACKNYDFVNTGNILPAGKLVRQVIQSLESKYSGDGLKAQNQLSSLFEKKEWIKSVFDCIPSGEREEILKHINASLAWDSVNKRHVMGRIIKMYPELDKALASSESDNKPQKILARITSTRSYREKIEQLRKITEEEIPKNSKDIGIARSYGDLKENSEYETARQQQGILMRRKTELENDLTTVRESDFSDFPVDTAGVGTCVEITRPDNSIGGYCILGEWDNDENLNIISCKSKLAKLLTGCKQGDEITLPDNSGGEMSKITGISGLSDEVKKWLKEEIGN